MANAGTNTDPGSTVSVFAPGSTTPTATLTGLTGPGALAFDAHGNLFVANTEFNNGSYLGTTVSMFASVLKPAAGGVVIRPARPGQSIHVGASGTGLSVSNAELAQIVTTAAGTVTFGGTDQTGDITFAATTRHHPRAPASPPSKRPTGMAPSSWTARPAPPWPPAVTTST